MGLTVRDLDSDGIFDVITPFRPAGGNGPAGFYVTLDAGSYQ